MHDIEILIVDDEVLIADYIMDILSNNGFLNIAMAHSTKEAQEKIDHLRPDIILMDINLEGQYEGIQLSHKKNENAHVIFITGQTDFITIDKALSVSPEAYLTKPIREVELLTAIKIAISKQQKNYIFIKEGYHDIKLKLSEIIYIQADKNYLDIITVKTKFTIRHTLQDFMKELPDFFKQIHRSIIINSLRIEKISSDEVFLEGYKLPVSRNFRQYL